MGNIKLKIPFFEGKNNPETYFKQEKMVELVFNCHNYSEFFLKKVKLVIVEFTNYTNVCQDQLVLSSLQNR